MRTAQNMIGLISLCPQILKMSVPYYSIFISTVVLDSSYMCPLTIVFVSALDQVTFKLIEVLYHLQKVLLISIANQTHLTYSSLCYCSLDLYLSLMLVGKHNLFIFHFIS